jgi:hypothetical protein
VIVCHPPRPEEARWTICHDGENDLVTAWNRAVSAPARLTAAR